ncbi:MAG: AGE family epimerase/isomerase [Acidobacteria bacterium]|nr:AGE family epimerase/isomerase [Acidobacteriota bacterium]
MSKTIQRRTFLSALGVASLGAALPRGYAQQSPSPPCPSSAASLQLAGMSLRELRQSFHDELFQVVLPFWDQHGVDHEYGGILCSLDYDGTLRNSEKLMWFQGRGLWVYSFLYNHLGRDPKHLEIARQIKDFILKYGRQEDGWWAEKLTRDGQVLKSFGGDIEGVYFIAEGLQEYAVAANDDQAREMALAIFKKLFAYFNRPEFRYSGPDFPDLKPDGPCVRPQGTWMLNLNIATQMLNKWKDPELEKIAATSLDAILHRHYNPAIGLNTEMLYFDFTRPPGEERKVRLGHGVEVLWMAMDEADRLGDRALWNTCAERIERHLDVAWDHVYGGMAQWVNIDQGGFSWPPETPVGTNFAFHFVGEYNYMKTLWGMNEVLIATLRVYERTRAEWAARYFALAHQVIQEKFRLRKRGLPGYVLFTDRQFTWEPHAARQDNYHPIRQLMLTVLTLDRMLG